QQRVRVFDIIVERQAQAITESGQIETIVLVERLLPLQVGIAVITDNQPWPKRVAIGFAILVDLQGNVVVKVLIAQVAIRHPKSEAFQPCLCRFEKFLTADIPIAADTPYRCRIFVASIDGSAVNPEVTIKYITIVIAVDCMPQNPSLSELQVTIIRKYRIP